MKKIRAYLGISVFLACMLLLGVHAAEVSTLEQGVVQYQKENYDEALELLSSARQSDPTSTRAAYYLGMTLKRLERYSDAVGPLKEAVLQTPRIKEALLELIETFYQLGEIQAAQEWIEVAEEEGIRPAQTRFLKGLILTRAADHDGAIEAFTAAKELDGQLGQAADYQIGLIHLREQRLEDAQKAFEEVLALDPNTPLANYADEYVKALDRRQKAQVPLRITAGVFWEVDDNVILKPSDSTVVENVSDSKDHRIVVSSGATYTARLGQDITAKLQYNLYLADQIDLNNFDLHSHTWGFVPTWSKNKLSVTMPMQYNHTWVEGKEFLGALNATPTTSFQIGDNQLGQIGCKVQWLDYLRTPLNIHENRDGLRVAPTLGWFRFFAANKGFVQARYEMDIVDAKGNNWAYYGHRFNGTVVVPIGERVKVSGVGDLFVQDFRSTHTNFSEKREDVVFTLSALTTWQVTDQADVQLRYTYVRDNANIPLFKYTRNVFSAGIGFTF